MAVNTALVEANRALLSFKVTGLHVPPQSSDWFKVTHLNIEDSGPKLRVHDPSLVLFPGLSGLVSRSPRILLLWPAHPDAKQSPCLEPLLRSGIKGRVPISWTLSWLRQREVAGC